ncbi:MULTISPECIES: arginine--tRNA ligase [Hyphomonas]|uniref:Arginine--tRNA ligase n=1 Tax=Hyphomonas adhaerens TaxID=81029 RepID=A0A3B9GUA1_9PROT|nr:MULTISPECIES: arginine--tRNA ligase [Hyphomonas]MBB40723.1 arginine--tRNA ligase [Hyphomonas sp.]HAE26035.1 arginine--tRNA ligase [Hyphomonas adhaerens]|tara:strand:- start:50 stop:1822 length:1773 start_codon:yes stop_codon:yes gene_type:complete
MASLMQDLSAAASAAFEAMGLEARWGDIRRSDKPELADFQCNGAMGAAKKAGKIPRDVAAEVAAALKENDMVLSAEVAGPGFINIRVSDDALAARAEAVRGEKMAGAEGASDPQVTVIDFGGPNVAKPMHVGHLRSAVIGDTLRRLLTFLGDQVTGDVHLGDWGLQMGHLVTELQDEQPGLIYFDADFTGPYPEEPPVTIDDLARMYPAASAKAKDDPARLERSQKAVAELQAGRPGYRALLKHFIDVSVAALKIDYEFLNVHFDLWKGESDVDDLIPDLVEQFKKAGLAEEDGGAVIVRIARDSDKKEMPPVMLINSRGGTGYHTTDLATIMDRMETLQPTPQRMLYVVDQRQALHFEQVFRAAEMVGLIDEGRLEHIGFGTVNGPDGKPFKTREGGVLRLADLNAMALEEAQKKIAEAGKLPEDMGAEEREEVAANVALAALRFSDLMNTRTTNYVFDLDKFTSFEGKTGPYLLYAAVRVKSLLRRAEADGNEAGDIAIGHDAERALVLQLDNFAFACLQAREKRMPHVLCEHLYNLAQAFSSFYSALPIASESDATLRASRLGLASAVLKQLETGLDLLGIRVPERM